VLTKTAEECSAFIFTVKRSGTACFLKIKALSSFKMSGTTHPITEQYIP
jgi:hypothetical protein